MVDIDLHNIQILNSQDIDLAQVSHVKEIESQNNYLKYGLVIGGVILIGLIIYTFNKSKDNKDKYQK